LSTEVRLATTLVRTVSSAMTFLSIYNRCT
jgi:hypothetical protein